LRRHEPPCLVGSAAYDLTRPSWRPGAATGTWVYLCIRF